MKIYDVEQCFPFCSEFHDTGMQSFYSKWIIGYTTPSYSPCQNEILKKKSFLN